MAIILKSKKYSEIIIDSKTIIGVLGNNYDEFIKSLNGRDVYYLDSNRNTVIDANDNIGEEYRKLLKTDNIINKSIRELSHSEKRLLKYYLMIKNDSKVMVINNPYLDLDNSEVKNINSILKKLVKSGKTIIIGSSDINEIYLLCKKVLIVNDNNIYYDDIKCLNNKKLLKKHQLDIPNIVEFIELAKAKGIKIPYSKDIRDLIKDVYRNVSKK